MATKIWSPSPTMPLKRQTGHQNVILLRPCLLRITVMKWRKRDCVILARKESPRVLPTVMTKANCQKQRSAIDMNFKMRNHSAPVDGAECLPSMETSGAADKVIPGAPEGWNPPGPPAGWKGPTKCSGVEVPPFCTVDNPGNWSPCAFQPKCKRDKRGRVTACHCHAPPTGATPVPESSGKREMAGREFHCEGWENACPDCPTFRSGATKDNPFPDSRKGLLDKVTLESLGLDSDHMPEEDGALDALFFHQLPLPICKQSGIPNDPRGFFCAQVAWWTNLCAIGELDLGCGTGCSHGNTDPQELVHWSARRSQFEGELVQQD